MKYYYKNQLIFETENKMSVPVREEERIVLYNEIYKRDGFIGVIQNLKETFIKGTVENINGLYKIAVGDLLYDNVMINTLLHPKSFMLKHYKGFVCNDIYYFSKEPYDGVKMINITQLEEDMEFEERTRMALDRVENDLNRKIMTKDEFVKKMRI